MDDKIEQALIKAKSTRSVKPSRVRCVVPRILVIDDDCITREIDSVVLRHFLGTRVIQADTNAEAFRKLAKYKIAAVISDLVRPGGSGFEFLKLFNETHPEIPVIICSGNAQAANIRGAKQLGAFAFLPKPYTAEGLVAIVRSALASAKERHLKASRSRKSFSSQSIGAAKPKTGKVDERKRNSLEKV